MKIFWGCISYTCILFWYVALLLYYYVFIIVDYIFLCGPIYTHYMQTLYINKS